MGRDGTSVAITFDVLSTFKQLIPFRPSMALILLNFFSPPSVIMQEPIKLQDTTLAKLKEWLDEFCPDGTDEKRISSKIKSKKTFP